MNKCLPCPFCGCKEIKHKKMKYNRLTEWQVLNCNNCTARMHGLKIDEVIKQWNERSDYDDNQT